MSDADTKGIIDKRIAQYVAIREKLREMDAAHEEARKPLEEGINHLASILMDNLDRLGVSSMKTAFGTCYSSTRTTASVSDGDAFMSFVIANQEFDLLERRASATAVKAYVQEHDGNLPPGVNLNHLRSIGVRKPSAKD